MGTYLVIIFLLLLSALFSGLTLGLMSLSASELRRKAELGDHLAAKVYAVRADGNLLLTTLLIGNVAVNSALAVFLGSIASGVIAGVVATALIVIFGEILPQAVFSRYALALGSKLTWLVRVFIVIFYVAAKPIALVLDRLLGEELNTVYSKHELIKIVQEHHLDDNSDVDREEAQIIHGALTFSHKLVRDVMTPETVMYSLEASTILDNDFLHTLAEEGFMRIPIYEGEQNNIIGVVHLSRLLKNDVLGKTIGKFASKGATFVRETDPLDKTFLSFIKTRRHMHIVKNRNGNVMGVITLEDILEEIIQTEILDENDS